MPSAPTALSDKPQPASAPEICVIGFSGGGNSTFLLRSLRTEGRAVIAAIVDHGLRAGSADDARRAAAIARDLGAEAEILTLAWPSGPKPAQAHARRARMAALTMFARRVGNTAIDLAHTLDDQAETVLLRLDAGSSWRGLAGMAPRAPAPLWPEGRGLIVRRPLLSMRRRDIRDALAREGADWLEDPANTLPKFARVRARARLAAWEGSELAAPRWAGLAAKIAPRAAALDEAARHCVAASVTFEVGTARLSPDRFAAFEGEARLRALGAVIAAISGAEREPAEPAVARLAAIMTGTLGGARLRSTRARVEITRDPGALLGRADHAGLAPLALSAGADTVWDGRLALRAREAGWAAEADPAGAAPLLRRGNACLTLIEAQDRGLIDAKWLFHERIAHLLWR